MEKAIEWTRRNRIPHAGIPPHPRSAVPYQEVTGYFIPTLYQMGEKEFARDLARWEATVQREDGAFSATDQVPYTFDTAQVIRGFLAVLDDMPDLEENLRRACDYVAGNIASNGRVLTPSYDQWKGGNGNMFSEYMNLYVLPPMLEAGEKLGESRYAEAATRALAYFRKQPDLVADNLMAAVDAILEGAV